MLNLDLTKQDIISNPEIERVQKEKMEYHIVGTYLRRRGMDLFSYNPIDEKIKQVDIVYSNTIHVVPENGVLTLRDFEAEKAVVDTRFVYFEAINMNSAKKRVKKWKAGKILELFNLRDPDKEPFIELKLW